MAKWEVTDIPDMKGKVIIITGANSGLGLESTKAITAKGGRVVMACRNLNKGNEAKQLIIETNPDAAVEVIQLDNSDLKSVRKFAEEFKSKFNRLDILFNNAGVMAIPRQETADGFEMQFGVNHLAHFALTGHLLDILVATEDSRVHTTSSSAAFNGKINFDDLLSKKKYSRWAAYGQSKLANAVFAAELNHRLVKAGHKTISNSSHPGLVMTNLQKNSLDKSGSPLVERILYTIFGGLISQDISMGVLPQLYAATSPEAEGGKFYGPSFLKLRGFPKEQSVNKAVEDSAIREKLWRVSAKLTGVRYLD